MEKVVIRNKQYNYISDYKNDGKLRNCLHTLTQKVWGFDFEKWYISGYWQDSCLLYSLLDGNKMVSHITVSVIDFIVLGKKKRFMQLGTVSTDQDYRKLGLNKFLMEKVLDEWKDKSDMIYLFANNSVLDYYTPFGFNTANEYVATRKIDFVRNKYIIRKLDVNNQSDHRLLYTKAKNAIPLFNISMVDNAGLVMFYCNYFDKFSFKENLYYVEVLDTIVIAEYKDNDLILYDILSTQNVEIEEVIHAMHTEKTQNVIMYFMPIDNKKYNIELSKEENSTLFVLGSESKIFENQRLIFPILSHT